MKEVVKLIVGTVAVLVGMALGTYLLVLIIHRVEGALFDPPILVVLVAAALIGGFGAIFGYVTLWGLEEIFRRRKEAEVTKRKERRRK